MVLGLGAIASTAIFGSIVATNNGQKEINNKFATMELRRSLIDALAKAAASDASCIYELTAPNGPYFDPSTGGPIQLQAIHTKSLDANYLIASVNQNISSISNNLSVSSIQIVDIRSTGVQDQYEGLLKFELKISGSDRILKSVTLNILLTTESNLTSAYKKIIGCFI